MTCSFPRLRLVWRRTCTAQMCAGGRRTMRRRGGHDRRQRVLGPALAEAGEEGEDEQGEAPSVRLLVCVDRQVDQAAADGERDRHREEASEHRAEPAEEERVRAADVVL